MISDQISVLLSQEFLDSLFPEDRADQFFEALLGDASEGAYDIRLTLVSVEPKQIELEFQLRARPHKCLVCNLTFGLPKVFSLHPIINIKGMVEKITARLEGHASIRGWHMGETNGVSSDFHMIPLFLTF